MLWYGKSVAEKLEEEVKEYVEYNNLHDSYVAIIMLGADHPGAAYVRAKGKCAERVGVSVKIFGNEDNMWTELDILSLIQKCNEDEMCVGIIAQLPLPHELADLKHRIMDAIAPYKDIDGLGSAMQKSVENNPLSFLPAAPRAVLSITEYYGYDLIGKKVAMLGYSDLIGKPLAYALRARGALVEVFTIESNQDEMKSYCHDDADMIISATGHIHLVDDAFVRDDQSQVVIDVGRGYKDGKAAGDVDRESIQHKVAAITPVPGGVGPVTVASLFANIVILRNIEE